MFFAKNAVYSTYTIVDTYTCKHATQLGRIKKLGVVGNSDKDAFMQWLIKWCTYSYKVDPL